MPTFHYQGITRSGERVMGVRTALNRQGLELALKRERIQLQRAREHKPRRFGGKVPARDLAIFFRQFSVMIDAGLPLVQCLELITGNQENAGFADTLSSVRSVVESGATLAQALRRQPKVFDELCCNMVEAGESGGILDVILQRLSGYMEKAVKLKAAVKSALLYPVTVIGFALLIVFFLLWKIVPIFTTLFTSLGAPLPLPTRIVIGISHLVGHLWWLILGAPFILVYALRRYYKTPDGRLRIDRLLLKLPLVGLVLQKIAIARFSRTLGTLITSGVPILEALDVTARTSGNAVIEQGLQRVRRGIEQGQTIVDPLRASAIFPNMVVQMIGAGEQTGAMDAMLQKIADFYEQEVEQATKNMLAMLEPVMICVLGVIVGGIVISMYLPMFSLLAQLSNGIK